MKLRFSIMIAGFILLTVVSSCRQKNTNVSPSIAGILKPEVKIKRYGKALLNISSVRLPEKLPELKKEFPFFLQGETDDTLGIIQLVKFVETDYIQEAKEECLSKYGTLDFLEEGLSVVFQRNKALFNDFVYPDVYTYISGFNIEMGNLYYDGNLVIALDLYLGKDFPLYKKMGFPDYKIRFFEKEYILRDVCNELNSRRVKEGKNLLQMAVAEGKKLLLLDALLPGTPDSIKIKYRQKQLKWIKNNERELWSFIIENDLLYSRDPKIIQKFFADAPYTSFFGKESPPRLGQWLGWQIARKYFENNPAATVSTFIREEDAQLILRKSGYRPGG